MATKTRRCTRENARDRLRQAELFLQAALLFDDAQLDAAAANVSAANAVMSAIAAADAACCAALGEHAQGQDHARAPDVVERIPQGGKTAAASLRRALAVKSKAQYGLIDLGKRDRDAVIRQAQALIEFAGRVIAR